MGDEEKTIEQIIAELEDLEKKKVAKPVGKVPSESTEELTPEESPQELTFEETVVTPPEVASLREEEPFEDIFGDKPVEELRDELTLEEPQEEALVLEEQREELLLEEPHEKTPDGGKFDDIFKEEQSPESHPGESSLDGQRQELTLEEQVVEGPEDVELVEEKMEGIFAEEKEEPVEEPPFEEVFGEREEARLDEEVPQMEMKEEASREMEPEGPSAEKTLELPGEEFREEAATEELTVSQTPEVTREEMVLHEPFEEDIPDGEGGEPPEEPPSLPPKGGASFFSQRLLFLLVVLIALGMYALFAWPTLYREGTFVTAGKQYRMRINRITKAEQYYEEGTWHSMPVQKAPAYRAPIKTAKKTPVTAPEQKAEKEAQEPAVKVPATLAAKPVAREPSGKEVKASATTPQKAAAEGVAKVSEKVSATGPEKASAGEFPTAAVTIPEKPSEEKAAPAPEKDVKRAQVVKEKTTKKAEVTTPAKKERVSAKTDAKPERMKEYTIQLGSMRFQEFAEDVVAKMRKKEMDAHMDIVDSKKSGRWYRVFIRGFESKDKALRFMNEKNLEKLYPGCFVRSRYLPKK